MLFIIYFSVSIQVVDPPFVLMDVSALNTITTLVYAPVGNDTFTNSHIQILIYMLKVISASLPTEKAFLHTK